MDFPIPELFRVSEAARIAGIGKSLAYEYVHDGTWPSLRLNGGKQIRIPRKGLEAWIAAMEEKANLASYLEEISQENYLRTTGLDRRNQKNGDGLCKVRLVE